MPTFAGYIKLDDTATWFAISDRIVDHGRNLGGLAPSTYEATLSATIPSGYPIGSFTPLADTRPLVGIDIAWIFQPYLTVLASMLALCLYELSGGLLSSPRLRAAVAFIAAQPALLFGYALWGGIKELGVALFVATLAALMPSLLGEQSRARAVIAPLVVGAAMVTILSFGGLAWIGPIALGAVVLALMRGGFTINARRAIGFAALALVLAAPALLTARTFFNSASSGDLAGGELGNLAHPLSDLQVFGIWPVGDFRLRPHDMTVTRLLVLVVLAFAIWGVVYAWRRRGWGAAALRLLGGGHVHGAGRGRSALDRRQDVGHGCTGGAAGRNGRRGRPAAERPACRGRRRAGGDRHRCAVVQPAGLPGGLAGAARPARGAASRSPARSARGRC